MFYCQVSLSYHVIKTTYSINVHSKSPIHTSMPLLAANERETKVKNYVSTNDLTSRGRGWDDRNNTHAMPAACNVERKPQITALGPIRVTRRVCDGARADTTPISMASEVTFANPHSAYDAIVHPRFDSASGEAISCCSSRYATTSFATSFVASSSETRMISERGTPTKPKVCRSWSIIGRRVASGRRASHVPRKKVIG